MWKRLNTRDRQFDRTVGSPTLVETTADQQIFRNSTDINNGSFSISSRPAFGRKGTGDVLKGLPALPFNSLQISGIGDSRPISEVPTTSSIYSQPSPEMNDITPTNEHPPRASSFYPDDVSPPESLHMDNEDKGMSGRGSPDVSPISDSSTPSIKHSPISSLGRFNSNLPIPKKTRKFWNRPSIDSPEQGSKLTHWDVYSGEPTTSEKGKPPSTTPSAVKLNADPSPGRLKGHGISTHISAGNPIPGNSIGRKRVASRDLNNAPIIRPEWKGAGGRHKIVNPPADKPLPPGKAPTFPAGSEKHEQERRETERKAVELAREQQKQIERERKADELAREQQNQMEMERKAKELAREQQKQIEMERKADELAREQQKQMEIEQIANERARHEQEQRDKAKQAEENAKREEQRREKEREAQEREEEVREEGRKAKEKAKQPITPRTPSTWKRTSPDQLPKILDKTDLNQPTASPEDRQLNSPTPPYAAKSLPPRTSSLIADSDTRSPLARNPSNEQMKDRRSQALPKLPESAITKGDPPSMPIVQTERPHIIPSAISKDNFNEHESSRIESRFRADLQHMHLHDEPASRFSATTYATTAYDSPPETPNLGSNPPSNATTPNSILNRKRPVPPAGLPNSRASNRKPTPSEMSVPTQATPESKRKSLPKSPPEVNAVSRVASLQAKLDNLRRRRGNLQTVIHELTHVVQPSSIAYDAASRQEIKKTVEGLNKELAEITKDEHETGIKLHRTMKRDDEFGAYEPTSIWVRRITS